MAKRLLRIVAILAVAGGLFYFWVLVRTGEMRTLEPIAIGDCKLIADAPGAEDITIHRPSATAFVSSFDRRGADRGEDPRGRILAYDLRTSALRDVTPEKPRVFRPHGIALHEDGDGLRLFVVNHRDKASTVEILDYEASRWVWSETIADELLISPNDLVAVGPRSFYATNDHGAGGGWRRFLEDFLGLARAGVVYFDGQTMRPVADGLAYANGIQVSLRGREMYVAGTTRGLLYIFERDVETGDLGEPVAMPLGTGVDNLEIDRHGMLWLAAHPKLLTFFRHIRDENRLSPSQVLWVDPDQSYEPPVRPVYLDLGTELSGSSVAAPWGDRLLIGSVFEGFLDCLRSPDV